MTDTPSGTQEEQYRLATAIAHNCECQTDSEGFVTKPCSAHLMLGDQAMVRRLVFSARLAEKWLTGEFKE
jgi:hypothetical protein